MLPRRAVHVPGLGHTNPIPLASVVGNLLASGGIPGRDPDTGEWGPDFESQCRLMFENVRRVVESAGGSTDGILRMTVWLRDVSDKGPLNDEWVRMFPDPEGRPARHTFPDPGMPRGQYVQCEILAVLPGDPNAGGGL
jgi:enamine deaminase RidA (YjgF/YER057c/UK114 family)